MEMDKKNLQKKKKNSIKIVKCDGTRNEIKLKNAKKNFENILLTPSDIYFIIVLLQIHEIKVSIYELLKK